MDARIQEIVFDCAEPAHLAQFWGVLLGRAWGLVWEDWAIVDGDPMLAFQRVPEGKQSPKNRLHLDVEVGSLADAAARAEGLGARVISEIEMNGDSGFVVLADPEDNAFCFVTDPTGSWSESLRAALGSSGKD